MAAFAPVTPQSLAARTAATAAAAPPPRFPPSTIPVPQPRVEGPQRPKRPLSASRVATHSAAATSGPPTRPHAVTSGVSPRVGRPASASRVRATTTTSTSWWGARRSPPVLSSSGRSSGAFFGDEHDDEDDDVDTIAITTTPITIDPRHLETASSLSIRVDSSGNVDKPSGAPPPDASPRRAPGGPALDAMARAELDAFLVAWEADAGAFRSPLLFAESSFAQAKAMSAPYAQPNAFLSSVALGALELACEGLARQHPFLQELLGTLRVALLGNAEELSALSSPAPAVELFRHGRWFHDQLRAQGEQLAALRHVADGARREAQGLRDQVQKHHAARLVERVQQARAQQQQQQQSAVTAAGANVAASTGVHDDDLLGFPQLRDVLYSSQRGAHFAVPPSDAEFRALRDELVVLFNSLRPAQATELLRAFHARAGALELPRLPEALAVAVDGLPEPQRREFLREYFQLVASAELQDALRYRDELNADKQWQHFLEEMKDVLRLNDATTTAMSNGSSNSGASAVLTTDEARVCAKVYDMVDLLEEVAAEAAVAEDSRVGLSPEVLARLRAYPNAAKKMAKARRLVMTPSDTTLRLRRPLAQGECACECTCGRRRLCREEAVDSSRALAAVMDTEKAPPITAMPTDRANDQDDSDHDDDNQEPPPAATIPPDAQTARPHEPAPPPRHRRPTTAPSSRGSSSSSSSSRRHGSRRPTSARSRGPPLAPRGSVHCKVSTRQSSMALLRVFALADVGHMLSQIVQLEFARETTLKTRRSTTARQSTTTTAAATTMMITASDVSFKALARDYLTRKYGIKSIASMHLLQLEKSLVHYAPQSARCGLFAWFLGADGRAGPRPGHCGASKTLAFHFFLRLTRIVLAVLLRRRWRTLSYAELVSAWTEHIGDGDTTSAPVPRRLPATMALEACALAFPQWMRVSMPYGEAMTRFRSLATRNEALGLEAFLTEALEIWHGQFERVHAEVDALITTESRPCKDQGDEGGDKDQGHTGDDADGGLHLAAFCRCLAAAGLRWPSGTSVEAFDVLVGDDDNVLSRKRALTFILGRKYFAYSDNDNEDDDDDDDDDK